MGIVDIIKTSSFNFLLVVNTHRSFKKSTTSICELCKLKLKFLLILTCLCILTSTTKEVDHGKVIKLLFRFFFPVYKNSFDLNKMYHVHIVPNCVPGQTNRLSESCAVYFMNNCD